ncbi:hypothetical protein MKW92_006803 [Papaver armeniacum]|nr:hypothetical protein MKW92_006803 [Papaver armeniacum]
METNFRIVFSAVFFFVIMIMVSTTADARKLDEKATREKLKHCMEKGLDELNKTDDFVLTTEQLIALGQIVNAEIDKHPLTRPKKEEVYKATAELNELINIDPRLSDLPMEKVSKRIKDTALKCIKKVLLG